MSWEVGRAVHVGLVTNATLAGGGGGGLEESSGREEGTAIAIGGNSPQFDLTRTIEFRAPSKEIVIR